MKLAQWARENGISYRTAYRWFRRGRLPVRSRQMATGTIIVYPEVSREVATIYARGAKGQVAAQVADCMAFAAATGLVVTDVVKEPGYRRVGLAAVLEDRHVSVVLVSHRDRVSRTDAHLVEAALRASGRRLVTVSPGESDGDIEADAVEAMTSVYQRRDGRQAARKRAVRLIARMG